MDAEPSSRFWLLVPEPVRRLPADLAAVVCFVGLTNLVVLGPVVRDTPLRILFGLPLVLFVPGYTFIAALFPEAGTSPVDDDGAESVQSSGIDGIERVALSFGLSIAIVPLIGLILNFTPWGIRLVPILVALTTFIAITTVVAYRRRLELDPDDRFRVPYREWMSVARTELFEPDSQTDKILNVVLMLSVLLAVGSVGYAVAVPKEGESFTEFYILTENDDGELVADNYPTEFHVGEGQPVIVGIGNQEHEPQSYTVVVELQRVETENNETTVMEERELDRFRSPAIQDNETWQTNHTVTPTMTGDRLRLVYLLYRDSPPSSPTVDNAYREIHLWVNVGSQ
ncbi:DUF1616 domain-containing protein [Haloarcula sediminis]|uniref:DUF1616 domain-containing protein n=1 Tax=Haloarcula sediminis TaxID=3111777 RepID=UPI002D7711C1|nr:DUF1616 domain-containing protein [Haloarcula sp. CK38]